MLLDVIVLELAHPVAVPEARSLSTTRLQTAWTGGGAAGLQCLVIKLGFVGLGDMLAKIHTLRLAVLPATGPRTLQLGSCSWQGAFLGLDIGSGLVLPRVRAELLLLGGGCPTHPASPTSRCSIVLLVLLLLRPSPESPLLVPLRPVRSIPAAILLLIFLLLLTATGT